MSWERVGAASGIVSAILFGAAFIVFLAQDPTGSPRIPDIAHAADIVPYIEAHKSSMQVQVLLNSLGIAAFLWFLGALWARFTSAEGDPGRGAVTAAAGGIAGTTAVLAGLVILATALLIPEASPVLYALGVMLIGLGAVAFVVFFAAAARVILATGALPAAIGVASIVAALAFALGFPTVFADSGIFNAATGAFGYWVRFGVFVIWLLLASLALTMAVGGQRTTRRR